MATRTSLHPPLGKPTQKPISAFHPCQMWSTQRESLTKAQSKRYDQPRSQISFLDYHETISTYLWWAIVASFSLLKSMLARCDASRPQNRRYELNFNRMRFLTSGLAPELHHFLSTSKLNIDPCSSILRFTSCWHHRRYSCPSRASKKWFFESKSWVLLSLPRLEGPGSVL